MDYGTILLYCLFACLQMYILMAPGYLAFKKKFFTSKSVSIVSEILFVFLIPFYGLIEITRIGTMEILNIFWILIVNFVASLVISYGISIGFHYGFKLDERIRESFNLMCTIPAMGALPLVIGKAFCFPGGPIEGDIYCPNMIGLMMLCYLIVCISVFLIGYLLITSDKKRNTIIQEKLIYLWPVLINKVFKKDFSILYLFNKFILNKKKARQKFELFDKEHHNEIISLFQSEEGNKGDKLEQQKGTLDGKDKDDKGLKEGDVVIECVKGEDIQSADMDDDGNDNAHDSYFDNQSSLSQVSEDSSDDSIEERKKEMKERQGKEKQNGISKAKSFHPKAHQDFDQFCIVFERKDSFYPGHDIKKKFDNEIKQEVREVYFNKSNKHLIVNLDIEVPKAPKRSNTFATKPAFLFQTSSKLKKPCIIVDDDIKEKDRQSSIKLQTPSGKKDQIHLHPETIMEEPLPIAKKKTMKSKIETIKNYYQAAFDLIEEDPDNFNASLALEYEESKKEIMHKVSHNPPKFPIVRSAKIDQAVVKVIDEEWAKFEPKLKSMSSSFKGIESVNLDMNLFLKKVVSPPTISIMLGLILSISGIRKLIFNSQNHFFTNIVDGLDTLDKVMVPFLFLLIGLSAASTGGLSMNIPLKKIHIALVFIERFILIPFIGLFFIWLWKDFYGGIVKESLAFRIILYFPWCLPSAPNLAVIVNLTQYFFEEYGYLILLQNVSCVITLTILYMIYFITVGL